MWRSASRSGAGPSQTERIDPLIRTREAVSWRSGCNLYSFAADGWSLI